MNARYGLTIWQAKASDLIPLEILSLGLVKDTVYPSAVLSLTPFER